jgi:hydrogenase expression/formation protein HypC
MCVGVPMKLVEIDYPFGVAEAKGVRRNVGLQLLPEDDIRIGDYVIVHVGFAIEKVDRNEAEEIWKGFEEILRVMEEEDA